MDIRGCEVGVAGPFVSDVWGNFGVTDRVTDVLILPANLEGIEMEIDLQVRYADLAVCIGTLIQ